MCPAQIISPSSLSDTRDYYLVTYLPRVASKDYHTWSSYYKPQSVIGYTHMSVILKSLPVLIEGHPWQTGVWFRLPCTCHQPGGPYFKTAPVFYTPHYIFYQAYIVHTVLQPFLTLPLPLLTLPLSSTRQGFITQEEASVLNELYNYNPLLFDFACKRLVRGPLGEKFPPQVFKAHPLLPPFRHESKLLGSPV